MVLCGCHIAINHCILGVLVIVLMGSCSQWLLFVWLRMGYGFPVLLFGYWGDAWEAPTSIQHASSSGKGEPWEWCSVGSLHRMCFCVIESVIAFASG